MTPLLLLFLFMPSLHPRSVRETAKEDAAYYHKLGMRDLKKAVSAPRYEGQAKNIVFFVGDGMGVATHTISRIYKGQKAGRSGEEESLVWEDWDYTGLIKTYNTDSQVPDSAGTATAMFSGVKTRKGMLGLDQTAAYNVCNPDTLKRAEIKSIGDWAVESGKEVGIVSTARLTHATPGAMYSHSPSRDWESDSNLPEKTPGCTDIATQLVEALEGGRIKVALGGGRKSFQTTENGGNRWLQDLVNRWRDQGVYLETGGALRDWDRKGSVLGLFSSSHMDYETDRDRGEGGQPSIKEMTAAAIQRLQQGEKGFLLMVEGGRVDHAHHDNRAKMAMEETLALEEAVQVALEMTEREDTLIVVTADHSHAMTMNGYPVRGNSILGTNYQPDRGYSIPTPDGLSMPYTTISYANGPGFDEHFNRSTGWWMNVSSMDTESSSFRQMATFPLSDETHGGEDVSVYAIGPQAHLVTGVHEQSYLAHLVSYAGCLRRGDMGLDCPGDGKSGSDWVTASWIVLIVCLLL